MKLDDFVMNQFGRFSQVGARVPTHKGEFFEAKLTKRGRWRIFTDKGEQAFGRTFHNIETIQDAMQEYFAVVQLKRRGRRFVYQEDGDVVFAKEGFFYVKIIQEFGGEIVLKGSRKDEEEGFYLKDGTPIYGSPHHFINQELRQVNGTYISARHKKGEFGETFYSRSGLEFKEYSELYFCDNHMNTLGPLGLIPDVRDMYRTIASLNIAGNGSMSEIISKLNQTLNAVYMRNAGDADKQKRSLLDVLSTLTKRINKDDFYGFMMRYAA